MPSFIKTMDYVYKIMAVMAIVRYCFFFPALQTPFFIGMPLYRENKICDSTNFVLNMYHRSRILIFASADE